jgi:hypothetical protein
MRIKVGKQKPGQHVKLPGYCSKCIFRYKALEFCVLRIGCLMFGYFNKCTSEDIFKLWNYF